MVIFNKAKEKKNVPENSRETPGKHLGKVHLLMFFIKEAGLEKKTSLAKVQTRLEFGDNYANLWSSVAVLDHF